MYIYLISYDLRVPETSDDYKRLIKRIQSYDYWATPLKSVWFIKTSKSVSQVRDDLNSETDVNDGLLVIDITGSNWGTVGVSTEVTEWMKQNI